jgi:hypothetical protein
MHHRILAFAKFAGKMPALQQAAPTVVRQSAFSLAGTAPGAITTALFSNEAFPPVNSCQEVFLDWRGFFHRYLHFHSRNEAFLPGR